MRARAGIHALERENRRLREEVERLKGLVEELQEQLKTNSRNSSKPPSSDPPSSDPPSCFDGGRDGKHKPKGRSPGGQPGHEGKTRKLFPPEQVDQVIDCAPPERCECGGSVRLMDMEPERRQVLDIPPIKPVVTEYRLFAGICEACGRTRQDPTHLQEDSQAQGRPMDFRGCAGRRPDEQRGRAGRETGGLVAQTELRDSKRTRQRIRRTHARRMRNLQAPGAQCLGLSHASHRGKSLLGQGAPSLLPSEAPRKEVSAPLFGLTPPRSGVILSAMGHTAGGF